LESFIFYGNNTTKFIQNIAMHYTNFSFSANIFKILVDSTQKMLAIEIRNAEKKEVSFSVISLENKITLLEETGLEEAWRVGLSAIENNKLLLHTYTDTRLPDRKGIYAIDITKQEVIWEKQELRFEKLYFYDTQNIISTTYSEQNILKKVYITLENGNELVVEDKNKLIENQLIAQEPYFYTSNSEYFAIILEFMQKFAKNIAMIAFDYVEIENYFIILAYCKQEKAENLYDMHLWIFAANGEKWAESKITENLSEKEIGNRIFVFGKYLTILQKDASISIIDLPT